MAKKPAKDIDPRPSVQMRSRDGTVQSFRLQAPTSYAIRFEVWLLGPSNLPRAQAAALGLCAGPKASGGAVYRADAAAFGGAVIDHLVAQGVPYLSILAAGAIAYGVLTEGLGELTSEISAAEDFSGAPPAASTE